MMKYLSRKFIAACIVMAVASVALFAGRMDGTAWVAAVNVALGLYLTANVGQKAVTKENAGISPHR